MGQDRALLHFLFILLPCWGLFLSLRGRNSHYSLDYIFKPPCRVLAFRVLILSWAWVCFIHTPDDTMKPACHANAG